MKVVVLLWVSQIHPHKVIFFWIYLLCVAVSEGDNWSAGVVGLMYFGEHVDNWGSRSHRS